MRRLILIILATLLALGAIEGIARWWMHPAPAGLGEPVLAYRPPVGPLVASGVESERNVEARDQETEGRGQETEVRSQDEDPAQSSSPIQKSKIQNQQSSISSSSTIRTPLPELVSRSIPSLRCSTGTAARIDREDGITVHVAFFEWDLAASNNVLEAFLHLPEQCMGSIGLTLVKIHPPRRYEVRSQNAERALANLENHAAGETGMAIAQQGKSEIRDQGSVGLDRRAGPLVANGAESRGDAGDRSQGSGVGGQETGTDDAVGSSSSSPNPQSTIVNQQSSISSSSSSSTHSLSFDHTEFRDPSGKTIHAFKGVWVSGAANLLGGSLRGGAEQWRQIRWQAALKRFRPAHARVAQGAILGIANPDRAWEIFEESMLRDLTFVQ